MLIKPLCEGHVQMRCLNSQEANFYLASVGMCTDSWNRLAYSGTVREVKPYWRNYQAPKDASKLFNFVLHVAGWLPRGAWKIFQIDDSTSFGAIQASLLSRLLPGLVTAPGAAIRNNTYLFEFGDQRLVNCDTELLIANVLYLFLLFEGHGYLVSASSKSHECLSVQDGFVYFSSDHEDMAGANTLIQGFEANPLVLPKWATEIEIDAQRPKGSE